ncbi:30S ribosomal subunit maturation GTPase Era [Gammaproteobacteria bacterium]
MNQNPEIISIPANYRCGSVAIIGRPNVGKSTLLNCLIGQKISITAKRPQTTRHRILGICTRPDAQVIYVDTPGLHQAGKRAMSRYLNRTASSVLEEGIKVVLWLITAMQWTEEDNDVLERLASCKVPVFLLVNKIDRVHDKGTLLPYLQKVSAKREFLHVVPISALAGENVKRLEELIIPNLPEGIPHFPEDQVTDRSLRFLAAELVREKLIRHLGEELPYALTCEVERFIEKEELTQVGVVIWVERQGQKAIVIGKEGCVLKQVGREAREDMERIFGNKVYLETWVRIRSGWSDDEQALAKFGYG